MANRERVALAETTCALTGCGYSGARISQTASYCLSPNSYPTDPRFAEMLKNGLTCYLSYPLWRVETNGTGRSNVVDSNIQTSLGLIHTPRVRRATYR